jgi:hypothetical protein
MQDNKVWTLAPLSSRGEKKGNNKKLKKSASYQDPVHEHILRRTFDQTRAGRLVEAGGSLLEISEWLVTHASSRLG